jgi:hypothetical protein
MTETAGERHEKENKKVERDIKLFFVGRLESYLIHIQIEMMLAQRIIWKRMCYMRMLSQVIRIFMLY